MDVDKFFREIDEDRAKKAAGKGAGTYLYEGKQYQVVVRSGSLVAFNEHGTQVSPMEILMYGRKSTVAKN